MSQPVVITIFTQSVRPNVRPSQNLNQATITAGRDLGLAEWIIDDSCPVLGYFYPIQFLRSSERRAFKIDMFK